MRWFFWSALLLSLVLHVVAVLGEPVYLWMTETKKEEPKAKETKRKLQSQQLAEDDPLTELKNVKPAEKQVVFLQVEPLTQPAPKPVKASAPKRKRLASTVLASAPVASAPAVASEAALAAQMASATASAPLVQNALATSASSASSATAIIASAPNSMSASRVARASGPSAATKINHSAAQRFPKEVQIEYRYAVVTAYLNWKLSNNAYDLELKVLPMGVRFISRGRIGKEGVMPEYFADISNGPDVPKNEVKFDWATMQATINNKGQITVESFEPGDQDVMSAALHLALMGGAQPEYEMSVFTGKKRYTHVHYAIKGEAPIKVGEHEMTALLMAAKGNSNQADFWLAPDWNNLPVRMIIHTEKYGRFDLSAYNLSLDGKKVLETIDPGARQQPRR
ncbi:DUF3108 domain-containing protein [Chitinibacter bivalviorum]|uniref:DUF3108 domain-containing protein n=1 Tax=Chitinibacter bivalviorum TaxID=2739434 RepID=A0A7H9BF27_9NEIS|nr:DUF3108 domain-containing protein [Chitinibacter bivalviorum]QLG87022.1 DUF3108 domain-containing protein [Chitinibacter bivalviorum]